MVKLVLDKERILKRINGIQKEICDIINKNLTDFDIFLKAVKEVISNPKKIYLE